MTPHARTASIFASTTSISLMNITIPFPVVTAFIPGSSTADRIPSPVSTSHRKKNAHPSSRSGNKLPLIAPATVGRGHAPAGHLCNRALSLFRRRVSRYFYSKHSIIAPSRRRHASVLQRHTAISHSNKEICRKPFASGRPLFA